MIENQDLLSKLEKMLPWKQSKKFYADKLGVDETVIGRLLYQLKGRIYDKDMGEYLKDVDITWKIEENTHENTRELTFDSDYEIKTLDELIDKCKIDTKEWEVTKYVQNYWGNAEHPHWQVKACLGKKSTEQVFQDKFVDFLTSYTPKPFHVNQPSSTGKPGACLLINKQDAHYNRADYNRENDDINERFFGVYDKTRTILKQASLSNDVETIVYVLGSDVFNSEFTNSTTKGTPQENILSYHEAFEKVCNHEIEMINLMLKHSTFIDVVFVPGNHDEYAGWHLVSWLKAYFSSVDRITFDISPKYRKYVGYGRSAMMFNHGDTIKPERLVSIFPIEFKDGWSSFDYFYIFTGDKHVAMSQDFNGIEFYRLSALSTVSSKWEDKNGYLGRRPSITAFLIDEDEGMTNIFKQYL